jgi:Sulfotransferase domain
VNVRAEGRLPDFLVIGAMKAGTTSLHHYLGAHPQVFMPKVKELDFFTEELSWRRGWDWYRRQFAAVDADIKAVGEASTSYTKYPRYQGVAERIGRHLPNARLIYVVRDPFERIRSHYQHNVAIGQEEKPIDEAVTLNPVYVDYSRYALQFERYLQHFDRSQMLLLTSEDLRLRREDTIQNVLEFIGVDLEMTIDNLDQEFYRTEDRPAYGRLLGGARRKLKELFPGAVGLWRGRFLPAWLKRRLGRPVRSESSLADVAMSDATRAAITRELHDDITKLRTHMGTEFDGWGIA